MKKNLKYIFLTFLMVIIMTVPSFAEGQALPRVYDEAGLLTAEENAELTNMLNEISERQKLDVVIATAISTAGADINEVAQDFYDYSGYGYGENHDGVIFMISMEERQYAIRTTGYGITAFTDAGLDYIEEHILSDLGDGYYYDAFSTFAELSDQFITAAKEGSPIDQDNMPEEPVAIVFNIIAALVIGFLVAYFMALFKRKGMKTIVAQRSAYEYTCEGSVELKIKNDRFINTFVTHRVIEEENGGSSTSIGSSGRTHGGTSGSF